jgi:mRNA interferase MazF
MAGFIKGDVVVVPFPYSDLTQNKRRPAVVVKPLSGDDVILCQITSRALSDGYAIPLDASDFTAGKLSQSSNIRPNRLFTADSNIILYRVGSLTPAKMQEIITAIVRIVES